MSLKLKYYKVEKIEFGDTTGLKGRLLSIDKEELKKLILEDTVISDVDIEIVKPGDSTRIIHVMDAIEPRVKAEGRGGVFPGFVNDIESVGSGVTNVLKGVAVIQTGQMQGVQEGIIDMIGPGAKLSTFSNLFNVVLIPKVIAEARKIEFDQSLRNAGLKAAQYLAKATLDNEEPDEEESFELDTKIEINYKSLPRIAYVCHLQSQGVLRNTFIYGKEALGTIPTLINPTEFFDGAVVSGNYIIACQKNPTYFHLNNPVVLELSRRHGKDLYFAGVIIANESSELDEKKRSAMYAAKLAEHLKADGVIITQEGGGHADTDLMLVCRECEKKGIKTTIIANELGGPEGKNPSLVDSVPEAVAIVSTGNNDEQITLASVERVVGGSSIAGLTEDPREGFITALGIMYCATNQLGVSKMTVKSY